jgi:hypothetical protein
VNLGLNRKCWTLFHRAIAYCQLLGFHRPERIFPDESEERRIRRNQSWLSLCSRDVYLSLLLGLPYAADGRTIPVTEDNRTALLHHKLILISVKVIDRNQMGLALSTLYTKDIEQEIQAATQNLDPDFWNSPVALASGKITQAEYLENLATQFWFYQVLVLLHMPLMIHSVQDPLLGKHRTTCLEACRNLLRTHHIMRSDISSAFNMVKLIDYQAFICSTLLLLGMLGYGSSTDQTVDQEKDRDMIGLTVATLRQASGTVNNPIASDAVQGLETLLSLDAGNCKRQDGSPNRDPYARIMIPQMGSITITPGKHITETRGQCSPQVTRSNPAFALSHNMSNATPGQLNQFPSLVAGTEVLGVQESELQLGEGEGMHLEPPSIDIDWTSATMPVFENDWAWLNDLNF